MSVDVKTFCGMLDATSISALATREDMQQLIDLNVKMGFFSLIGPRCFVPMLVEGVRGTSAIAGSGCCGDDGCEPDYIKAYAAKDSIKLGAQEIDMVMNLHYFKSGMYAETVRDIRTVKDAIGDHRLKCIIESPLMSDAEIAKQTELVIEGGADFVKTSIGGGHVATVHQVEVIAKAARGRIAIKASGGIRELETVEQMMALGVSRFGIGMSSVFKIIGQIQAR